MGTEEKVLIYTGAALLAGGGAVYLFAVFVLKRQRDSARNLLRTGKLRALCSCQRHPKRLRWLATEGERRATAVGFVSDFSRSPLHPVSTKASIRAMIRIRGFLKPGTVWRTATCLRWRLQFTRQPTNIARLHRVRRYNDFFDVIAFGAVERAKFESFRPRCDVGKLHANLALWAAESLNCEQWDCGWIIGHCIPPSGQAGAQNSQSPVDAKVGR